MTEPEHDAGRAQSLAAAPEGAGDRTTWRRSCDEPCWPAAQKTRNSGEPVAPPQSGAAPGEALVAGANSETPPGAGQECHARR